MPDKAEQNISTLEQNKTNPMNRFRTSMAANIIGAIILLLVIFGIFVITLGFISFNRTFNNEYSVSTYHMADTATLLINGDHLDDYLAGDETEEYIRTKGYLDNYCNKISVSLIYVILVDNSDYGRFVSIFNSVNNAVDNSSYTEWELGHKRDTTNDEYRQKYKAIYEQGSAYETVYRIKTTDGQHPHITTMVPVKDSSGDVAAILCIQRPVREIRNARQSYLRNIVVLTVLLALLSSLSAVRYLGKNLVKPMGKVSAEASRFARENTKGEELGVISRYKELTDLARSIDTMEDDMVSYISNLTSITAENERINTELSLAGKIQAAMLPHVFPPFPERKEFDIFARMDPAREVGGDFYDFFLIDEDHLGLVMADVSGKGIPAALFMMVSKIIVQSCAMLGQTPSEILTKTNEALTSNNQEEMFVTVWMGILEISTGKLTAASAGHEYPAIKEPDGQFEVFKDKHGFVLGGMPDVQYTSYELQLFPGSKLFLYTDGLPEATDKNNAMLGLERMTAALNSAADKSPREILHAVNMAVTDFVGNAEQFDDLTMMCIQYNGHDPEEGEKTVNELTVNATLENISVVTEFIDARLEALDCPFKAQTQIDVAVDEIVNNIASYAYETGSGELTVRFELMEEPRTALISFIDRGKPFDPLKLEDPDVTLSVEERGVGGLGIFLVKKTMDAVNYKYEDGRNILQIEKRI